MSILMDSDLSGVFVCIFFSEMELKPQGRLAVTVVKATCLVNMEMIGKSDPYVVLYIRPMLKVKTKVVDHNLNPEWNETFHLIVEDKETQEVIFEVFIFFFCFNFIQEFAAL